MTKAKNSTKGKPGPKQSKSPRGGRFSPIVEVNEPDPNWPTDPSEALGRWLDTHKDPADEIEEFVAEVTRVAHEYLGAHGVADNEPAKVWAGNLLVAVGHWRGSIGGPCAAAMLAYGDVVKAAVLMAVYSEDRLSPRKASAAGNEVNTAKADANMDDMVSRLRRLDAEGKIPNSYRCKPAVAIAALEADAWVSPWGNRKYIGRKIREGLKKLKVHRTVG